MWTRVGVLLNGANRSRLCVKRDNRIEVREAREGPLADVNVDLPLGSLICFTGRSGSGARTMAVDVLFAESRRRYMLALSAFERESLGGLVDVEVESISGLPPAALIPGHIRRAASVMNYLDVDRAMARLFHAVGLIRCPECGAGRCRSFSPEAAAKELVNRLQGERSLVLAPVTLHGQAGIGATVKEIQRAGFTRLWVDGDVARVDDDSVVELLSKDARDELVIVVDRLIAEPSRMSRLADAIRSARAMTRGRAQAVGTDSGREVWLNNQLTCQACGQMFDDLSPEDFQAYLETDRRKDCDPHGDGNHWLMPFVTVAGRTIGDVAGMAIEDVKEFCAEIRSSPLAMRSLGERSRDTIPEDESASSASEWQSLVLAIEAPVSGSQSLALGHLSLARPVEDLAAGEYLRLGLAAAASRGLVGVLYIVDTPISFLDAEARAASLRQLRELVDGGNTALIVDNSQEVREVCDYAFAFDAGRIEQLGEESFAGGASASIEVADRRSPDRRSPDRRSPDTRSRGPVTEALQCRFRASGVGNLSDIELGFPSGRFVCLTGVSGAGKSTLMRVIESTLSAITGGKRAAPNSGGSAVCLEHGGIRRQVSIDDQARSLRERTALGALGLFRRVAALYARTAISQERGYSAEWFELERPGGRCTACGGSGRLRYELEFLEDLSLTCPTCLGRRYREEILAVTIKGLSVGDVLDMQVGEASHHFSREKQVAARLAAAARCGLETLLLGRDTSTLEQGERLRLRLATELVRVSPQDIILLDQPVAGAHADDVELVIDIVNQLVDEGATVVAAGSHSRILDAADWIVSVGPGRGESGGRILYSGAPESDG